MKLKKCAHCKVYVLMDFCSKCKNSSINAHYKFVKIRDAPKSTIEHFNKRRKLK